MHASVSLGNPERPPPGGDAISWGGRRGEHTENLIWIRLTASFPLGLWYGECPYACLVVEWPNRRLRPSVGWPVGLVSVGSSAQVPRAFVPWHRVECLGVKPVRVIEEVAVVDPGQCRKLGPSLLGGAFFVLSHGLWRMTCPGWCCAWCQVKAAVRQKLREQEAREASGWVGAAALRVGDRLLACRLGIWSLLYPVPIGLLPPHREGVLCQVPPVLLSLLTLRHVLSLPRLTHSP